MINKHILKFLKKTKKVLNTPIVDTATLTAIDGEIRLITNGIPSTILIQYRGIVFFESLMPIHAKVTRSKNTILITNIFIKKHKFFKMCQLQNRNPTAHYKPP